MAGTATGPCKTSLGPSSAVLNLTGPQVIKAYPGVLATITCVATGGTITFNDCATTGAAAATNVVATLVMTAGQVVPLNWPCATGIVLSAVSAGTYSVAYL